MALPVAPCATACSRRPRRRNDWNDGKLSDTKGALSRPPLSGLLWCCPSEEMTGLPGVELPSIDYLRICRETPRLKGSQCLLSPMCKGDSNPILATFMLRGQLKRRPSLRSSGSERPSQQDDRDPGSSSRGRLCCPAHTAPADGHGPTDNTLSRADTQGSTHLKYLGLHRKVYQIVGTPLISVSAESASQPTVRTPGCQNS